MSRVAFLGLGTMGHGMAMNLVKAGHTLTVWNRSPRPGSELAAMGAHFAPSAEAAVVDADFVMYCFSDDRVVQDVILGPTGISHAIGMASIVIDLSTIDPETSAIENRTFAGRGVDFLDAPVFGSKAEAESGGVWPVVGGSRSVFERSLEVLTPISESVHYMGGPGSGTKMKLVGNLLVAVQFEALGEALSLAKKSGLTLGDVLDVIRVTSFKSPLYDEVGASVVVGDYTPSFALKLLLKDAKLIASFAGRLGVNIPAATATLSTIERAVASGFGEQNASSLIKTLAEDADVTLTS